jgi:hypothetical protein
MHIAITKAARLIRHVPGIERCEWLWDAIRPGYHRLAGLGGRGIPFSVGGQQIRVPAEFACGGWDGYEPETGRVIAHWQGTALAACSWILAARSGCSPP